MIIYLEGAMSVFRKESAMRVIIDTSVAYGK